MIVIVWNYEIAKDKDNEYKLRSLTPICWYEDSQQNKKDAPYKSRFFNEEFGSVMKSMVM